MNIYCMSPNVSGLPVHFRDPHEARLWCERNRGVIVSRSRVDPEYRKRCEK